MQHAMELMPVIEIRYSSVFQVFAFGMSRISLIDVMQEDFCRIFSFFLQSNSNNVGNYQLCLSNRSNLVWFSLCYNGLTIENDSNIEQFAKN